MQCARDLVPKTYIVFSHELTGRYIKTMDIYIYLPYVYLNKKRRRIQSKGFKIRTQYTLKHERKTHTHTHTHKYNTHAFPIIDLICIQFCDYLSRTD